MPIDATPFEHAGELALATKCTEEPTLAPLVGLFTVTPARAGRAPTHKHTNGMSFPNFISQLSSFINLPRTCSQVSRSVGIHLLRFNGNCRYMQSEVHVPAKANHLENLSC